MRLLVVSSHVIIGHSLVTMLQEHAADGAAAMEVSLCDATHAIERAREWRASLILVDATADFSGAIALVRMLTQMVTDARIAVLGGEGDDLAIFEAISAGADGYLTRDTSVEALARTLDGMLRGELGLSRAAALQVVHQLRRPPDRRADTALDAPVPVRQKLTQREQEVFELVQRGMRSREISERLCIAEATVYKHIQNILDKLQVRSRTQAVLLATSRLEPEPHASGNSHTLSRRGGSGSDGGDPDGVTIQ